MGSVSPRPRAVACVILWAASGVPALCQTVATLAGSTEIGAAPARGFSGDGGPARRAMLALAAMQNECDPARFEQISHLAFDSEGSLYIADTGNQRIRRVDSGRGIATVAGNGDRPPVNAQCLPTGGAAAIGDGGPAAAARLYNPSGLAFLPDGSLVVADQQSNRVRIVSRAGVITTVAGNGAHLFYAPGIPALNSGIDWPTAVAVDPNGLIHFSELHSGRVARITADGRLVTVAGTGIPGFSGNSGPATSVRLSNPTGIAFDSQGNLYIADQGNHRVRRVTPDGALTTIAGSSAGFAGDGGPATAALLDRPADVKVDRAGNIYISDMNNHRVRRIDPAGAITTVAGDGAPARGRDGVLATSSSLAFPSGMAIDANGDLYVVDWGNLLIRRISFSGQPAVVSGGVLNGASFTPGPVAPGSLFTIFGVNLAMGSGQAAEVPWPAQIAGTSVRVNGRAAPLYFVSENQVNAQAPYETEPGEALVEVTTARGTSLAELFAVAPAATGVFLHPQSGRAIALNQDASLNSPESPETRGRVLTVFLTGVGAVTPALATGEAANFGGLHVAAANASATVGGVDAPVLFFGLTPGFIGLAQANVMIPEAAPAGPAVTISITAGGRTSNAATVAVR